MTSENLEAALDANIDDFLAQRLPSLEPIAGGGSFATDPFSRDSQMSSMSRGVVHRQDSTMLINTMQTSLHLHDDSGCGLGAGGPGPLGLGAGGPLGLDGGGPLAYKPVPGRFLNTSDSDSFNKTLTRMLQHSDDDSFKHLLEGSLFNHAPPPSDAHL